ATRFRRLTDAAGLVPSCLGANVDTARRRDRHMTDDETVESLEAQIDAARTLGFPVMRIQFGARTSALRRVVTAAEKADVRLGMEIHAPHSVDHPTVVALRELYDEIDSPYLGFIPDFGASVSAMPAGAVRQQREGGMPEDVLELIITTWQSVHDGARDAFAARRELMADLEARDAGGQALGFAWRALTLWGAQPPEKWLEIMPRVVHVHGKFFDIDENGEEPSVPYPELMRVFREGGYEGGISSEWEGRDWAEHPDGIAMVKAHQDLVRRHLAVDAPVGS
ncbi:MAG TPA: TIM barrel protein, partial [Microbacterium sp.]|uniref:sugar phosphate isomerase/epimerase family protein n=1 Tax=Microbacterium sp. TaxID=51671 RepID=UPI002C42D68B